MSDARMRAAGAVSVAVVLRASRMRQIVNRGLPQDFQHGALRFGPNRVGRARTPSHAGILRREAEIQTNRALDGFHHFEKRYLLPRYRQLKASGISPMRHHQTGARQALQNLRKELLRTFRRFRQTGAAGARVRWLAGQVNQHSDSVVRSSCELHISDLFQGVCTLSATFKDALYLDQSGQYCGKRGIWLTQLGESARRNCRHWVLPCPKAPKRFVSSRSRKPPSTTDEHR